VVIAQNRNNQEGEKEGEYDAAGEIARAMDVYLGIRVSPVMLSNVLLGDRGGLSEVSSHGAMSHRGTLFSATLFSAVPSSAST